MDNILTGFSTRNTPQNQKADARQVKNAAGGYTFQVSDLERLKRFLTLGSSSGTYYVGAAELTRQNAEVVLKFTENEDTHQQLVDTIVDISRRGAAPKNDYALFALAIASSHGSAESRRHALSQLHLVARTGSHLFLFATFIEQFRGWGKQLRRAVASWYTSKMPHRLAFQAVKYRQRGGWSHRDLLRLAHPQSSESATRATFQWIVSGELTGETPKIIEGYMKAQEEGANYVKLIDQYDLSWEMLPTTALGRKNVWEALIHKGMPQTALIRNLPRLTNLGVLDPMSQVNTPKVAQQLQDTDLLQKARVHPVNVLNALRTYADGHSFRGGNSWTPVQQIVDALDAAFYNSFGAVEPAGKRTMLALDVSGSMGFSTIGGMSLTPREASAALAMVQAATEPSTSIFGFTSGSYRSSMFDTSFTPLRISPRQRLDDVIKTVSGLAFGGTDCALPMQHALRQRMEVDTFVVYTDNETWAGRNGHPHQALQEYREKMGIDAKLVVVGMSATDASIADPNDPGMLDIAGFDAGVPNLINEFSRGF